ncbi:hypothetical protein GL279_06305 [Paracoccus limosus]|jgi:hypothetical protein|uniref:Uncharacterized protein n=1 Tax=Paracoccus limosus TaxID=913252 RepID=A0A844H3U3_9RHOB|nr:hypothetical protein [Paracoccus limosus]
MGVALAMTCGAAGLFLLELSLLSCLGIYALSGAGAVLMLAWAKTHCRAAA